MFPVAELIEAVPGSLMSGIVPVVPPVKMSDAVKSGDVKKKAGQGSVDLFEPDPVDSHLLERRYNRSTVTLCNH